VTVTKELRCFLRGPQSRIECRACDSHVSDQDE